jgi:hypothetical protein
VKLALVDPDSNFAVPWGAPRFAGDFELTSEGDKEQTYAQPEQGSLRLHVLSLSQSVDDTAWITGAGQLFAADTSGDTVDRINGNFGALGQLVQAVARSRYWDSTAVFLTYDEGAGSGIRCRRP